MQMEGTLPLSKSYFPARKGWKTQQMGNTLCVPCVEKNEMIQPVSNPLINIDRKSLKLCKET